MNGRRFYFIMTQNSKKGGLQLRSSALVAKNTQQEEPLFTSLFKNAAKGLLCFIGIGLLLLAAMTAFAYAQPDPAALVPMLSLVALLPTAFASGFITTKLQGDAPMLCGIVTGSMITVFTIACSLILRGLPTSGQGFVQSALLHGAVVVFCILGAFAGNVKRKAKPGKRRFG